MRFPFIVARLGAPFMAISSVVNMAQAENPTPNVLYCGTTNVHGQRLALVCFSNSTTRPISFLGFRHSSEPFYEVQRLKSKRWSDFDVNRCGTGAATITFDPGKQTVFMAYPHLPYGTWRIGVKYSTTDTTNTVWSLPFQPSQLSEDVKLIRKTTPLKNPTPDAASTQVSSPDAVMAAHRIFSNVHFVGMSRKAVLDLLGDPKTISDYGVKAENGKDKPLIYAFDSGFGGSQYALRFKDDVVTRLERISGE